LKLPFTVLELKFNFPFKFLFFIPIASRERNLPTAGHIKNDYSTFLKPFFAHPTFAFDFWPIFTLAVIFGGVPN
jgi:hypothetical protein